MARHLEANEESETPEQIKMVIIMSFEDHLLNCKNKP